MALPYLPGNTFNPNVGKTKYHKSHHFDQCNQVRMMVGDEKPGIGGEVLPWQKCKPKNSRIPRGDGSDMPAWVAFDKQVLSFDAYFQEAVHEKREEQYRVRKCKIYFYLEDDSIQVIEPRLKNSGVPQGTIIRRHRIPRPAPNDDEFYTVEDFNVDHELTFYGRTFHIIDCDQFTLNFLKKLGVRVKCPSGTPDDPYMNHRKALDESMQPLRPYEKHDKLKQFLDHDGHVLRFYCYWDDTDSMFGDPREMVLHYFLSDNTIEMREKIPANAGRDAAPLFLNRNRLPKNVMELTQPGVRTDRTVLNVFGPTGHGGRYILDSLKTGAIHPEYYTDADLAIGESLNVWGRKFVLCDCDEFTKEFYRNKYGITEFKKIDYKLDCQKHNSREFPPYNGFGGEEDSLGNCLSLLPKPPKRDFIKFMEKDRFGLDSNILRYLARLHTTKPIDADRRFIISYYLSDDTIQVFEPPMRNSGIIGGKFMERGRVKRPDQPMYNTKHSEYYNASDLYVGNCVEFAKFQFIVVDADEYAFNYMERHAHEFPVSDASTVMQKIKSLSSGNNGGSGEGTVSYEQFREMLCRITNGQLSEHEIMTVARSYQDGRDDGAIPLCDMIALAQEQLRRKNFEGFSLMDEQMLHHDSERCGVLDVEAIRTVFRALKVPVKDDLIRCIVARLPANEKGQVDYRELVCALNWRVNPLPPLKKNSNSSSDDSDWKGNPSARQLSHVKLGEFMRDLNGGGGQSGAVC